MRIKRYQSGGIYYTPFFGNESTPQATSKSTKSTEDKEEQLIQKEIISVLKENGLQNDVDYFLKKANNMLQNSFSFGTAFGEQSSSYDMSDLIRVMSLANRVRRNYSDFANAAKQVQTEGAGSEVAVTDRGALYVFDNKEKKVKTMSAQGYHDDRERYIALTNSELLQLRESNPELAYNTSIIGDLNSTIGMQSIIDHVKEVINAFGTNQEVQTHVSFTEKKHGQVQRGLEQMLSGATDGIYEVRQTVDVSDQGYKTAEELNAALEYLYSTLNPKMKYVLAAQAVAEGLEPKDRGIQLLKAAIIEHTDHSIKIDPKISYESSMSKASGSGSSSGKMEELTREQMGAFGTTISPSKVTIHASDGSTGFTIDAQSYGKSEDRNKDIIGRARLIDVLRRDRMLGHQVDSSSITFGDQLLRESDLDRVVYDGTSNIERITMAYDTDIYASSGKIVPDLDAARRYQEFLKWCDAHPDAANNVKLVKAQNDFDLDVTINRQGQFVLRNTQLFYVINGYASNQAFNFNDKSKWLTHIDEKDGEYVYDIYSRIVNYGGENTTSTHKTTANFKRNFWVDDDNTMYKGLIFMPITDPNISTVTSGTEFVPQSSFIDIQNRNELLDAQAQIKTNW